MKIRKLNTGRIERLKKCGIIATHERQLPNVDLGSLGVCENWELINLK